MDMEKRPEKYANVLEYSLVVHLWIILIFIFLFLCISQMFDIEGMLPRIRKM